MINVWKTVNDFDKRMVALGFTPQAFCPRVPMHFTAFYRWRRRERQPTLAMLNAFELALRRAERRKAPKERATP